MRKILKIKNSIKEIIDIISSSLRSIISAFFHLTLKDVAYIMSAVISCTILAIILRGIATFFPEDALVSNLLNDVKKEWYMSTFFSEHNYSEAQLDSSNIVILDVGDSYSSRENIAEIIRKTAKVKPQIICVDFLFLNSESYDVKQNNTLCQAIAECKDSVKMVFAAYKRLDESITKSFFMDSLSLEFGLSNFSSFYEFIPYINDTIPRITTVLAKGLGINVDNLPNPLVINYRRKDFDNRFIGDREDIDNNIRENLTGKIVLIGQNDVPDDIHLAPFVIKDGKDIPGIEIIAYELSSLVNQFEKASTYRHPYTYLSTWHNVTLYFFALIIYIIVLNRIYLLNKDNYIPLFHFFKIVWLFFAEFVIISLCFCITATYFFIPNIVLFTVSLLYVEPLYEVSVFLINKNNYEKKKNS